MSLTLDEATHQYKHDNIIVPSVTQIIKDAGLINLDWVDKELLAAKADLGHKVHKATELYDTDSLGGSLHPTLQAYLDSWVAFKKDYSFVCLDIELQLVHTVYRFAGRIDRIGFMKDTLTLLDIKSGTVQKSNAIQTAAYELLYNQDKKKSQQIKKRMVVYISLDGYKVEPHEDPNDKNVFLAALTISNYKRRK